MPKPSSFRDLIRSGRSPAQIAAHFGVTQRFVEQMIRSQREASYRPPTAKKYAVAALQARIDREQREIAAKSQRIEQWKKQIAEMR